MNQIQISVRYIFLMHKVIKTGMSIGIIARVSFSILNDNSFDVLFIYLMDVVKNGYSNSCYSMENYQKKKCIHSNQPGSIGSLYIPFWNSVGGIVFCFYSLILKKTSYVNAFKFKINCFWCKLTLWSSVLFMLIMWLCDSIFHFRLFIISF